MEKKSLHQLKIFYGYWIILAAFFCIFIFSGCGVYVFSLFVSPLQTDFGWSRDSIMAAFTMFYFVMGATSPLVGRMIDRYGAKKIILIGSLIAGLGFIMLSQMHNIFVFYAGYIIIGLGISASGQVPATAIVSNWFHKRRGTAIGIISTGVGAGGFAVTALIGNYLMPNFDWRTSYLALALITWILIPLALWVVKTKPADMGLYPDGVATPETVNEDKPSLSIHDKSGLKFALGTSAFWLIAISFLTSNFSHLGIIQNQVPHLQGIGFDLTTASTALGTLALGSLVGKFGFGWLCDHIPSKYACAIGLVLQAVAIAIFMSVDLKSPSAMLLLYAIIMGLGGGSWLPTMSMLVSTNFGIASLWCYFRCNNPGSEHRGCYRTSGGGIHV